MRPILSAIILVLISCTCTAAIQTDEIANLRARAQANQGNINESDKAVIAKFLRSAIDTMFLSDSSAEVAEIRRQIVRQKGTENLSLYASAYLTEARQQIRSALETTSRIQDTPKKLRMRRNLIILAAELDSLLLTEFGIDRINDPDAIVRYWAVKSIADETIAQQLNSEITTDPEKAAQIFETLLQVIQNETLPATLKVVAEFGTSWQDLRSQELLQKLVDARIKTYQAWNVRQPWLDGLILKALADKYEALKLPDEKAGMAREFSRLLAVIVQKWMKGQDVMTEAEKNQLLSVIMEANKRILEVRFGIRTTLESAMEGSRPLDQRIVEDLFGSATRAGELGSRLKFTYVGPQGQSTTAPPQLPDPPAEPEDQSEEEGAVQG